ncbi:MAG: hypothetical protein IPO65_10140 [Saprospiraceae bacterium]|nr:hypothetical protein [Saprospiraceae bacterium]
MDSRVDLLPKFTADLILFAYSAGTLLLLSNVYVYIMDRLNSSDVGHIERSRYFGSASAS